MKFNFVLLAQYLTVLVSFISVIINYLSIKSNNRNAQKMQRKREKLSSIANLLTSVNLFMLEKNSTNQQNVIISCSNLLPIINNKKREKDIVNGLLVNIREYDINSKNPKNINRIDKIIKSTVSQLLNIENKTE